MKSLNRLLLAATVLLVLGLAASAFAAVTASPADPLRGIAVAANPRTAADVVDQATAALVSANDSAWANAAIGTRQISESKAIHARLDGRRVYLIPTDRGALCVAVERLAQTCSGPLSADRPATFTIIDSDGAGNGRPVAFGVARDGVVAVAFSVAGRPETVAVRGNWFVFRGLRGETTADFSSGRVIYVDGSSAEIR